MNTEKMSVWGKVFSRKKPLQIITGGLELLWGYPLYCLSYIFIRINENGYLDIKMGLLTMLNISIYMP